MSGLDRAIERDLAEKYRGELKDLSVKELYSLVSGTLMESINAKWSKDAAEQAESRTAYYLSAEFLVGRAIYSNLMNLDALSEVKGILEKGGVDPAVFEEIEDAALGNGGLGRLAACFLDSGATLGLNLNGYGIRYKYGLFKQRFESGFQREAADDWQRFGDPWSVRRESERVEVRYKDQTVWAVPYDMPVIGYKKKRINTLRLWQSEAPQAFDFSKFDANDYAGAVQKREDAERISMVLYPNDNGKKGKELRLKQEYFFSSASLQDILTRFESRFGSDYEKLPQLTAVQLNDTHPVVAIPELIRLLESRGVEFSNAFAIAKRMFAYTNHTVMQEALEKWDVKLMKAVIPDVYAVIAKIQKLLEKELRARKVSSELWPKYFIVEGGRVHMARLASFAGFAINGVAKIHTEILKRDTLKEWYSLYPEKFFNKTNGITQRRWLALCNPDLSEFITDRIGDRWITNLSELKKLEAYADSEKDLLEFARIKSVNKRRLAKCISEKEGVTVNPDFLFDIQIKRLHEYKRQLLNALSLIYLYRGLKEKTVSDFTPTVFLFGAKAAPGYRRAKGIIKLVNCIAEKVNADPDLQDKMKVVFVTDYNVSYAEKLVAAGDVSEQISAAGTEASGTGNMKLMLNGAVTLGTYDGANIEIVAASGEENNYIFGARVEELDAIRGTYDPKEIYEGDAEIKRTLDALIDGTFDDGGTGMFRELYDSILEGASWHKPDNYFVLKDFRSYLAAKLAAGRDYRDRLSFTRKCLMNTANAGGFSSDRTILEYAKEIWKL